MDNQVPWTSKLIVGGCMFALQTIGVDPGPIFWAMVGASLGMSFAKPTPRLRAAVIFVCVVLACSLFGAAIAQHFFEGGILSRNACACALAIGFHPLLNLVVDRLPRLFDLAEEAFRGLLRRWFGGPGEGGS